eukprot:EG_transcript_42918
MATGTDTALTLAPYFEVADGKLEEFKAIARRAVEASLPEKGVGSLAYAYTFNGNTAYVREVYKDAQAVLLHLGVANPLIQELLAISTLSRFEVHGPKEELAKLKEPMAALNPQFFVLEFGFRA